MKAVLIFLVLPLLWLTTRCPKEPVNAYKYEHLVYQGSLYPSITKRNVAIVLVDFPDTQKEI